MLSKRAGAPVQQTIGTCETCPRSVAHHLLSITFPSLRESGPEFVIREAVSGWKVLSISHLLRNLISQPCNPVFHFIACKRSIDAIGHTDIRVHQVHADRLVVRHRVRMLERRLRDRDETFEVSGRVGSPKQTIRASVWLAQYSDSSQADREKVPARPTD